MEKLGLPPLPKRLSAQQNTTKKKKKKSCNYNKQQQKKTVMVVYITNPIKVKTTASEFKALVQELTGKDADYTMESFAATGGRGCEAAAAEENNVAEAANSAGHGGIGGFYLDVASGSDYGPPWMIQQLQGIEGQIGGFNPEVASGSGYGVLYSPPRMVEQLQEMDSSQLDIDFLDNLLL